MQALLAWLDAKQQPVFVLLPENDTLACATHGTCHAGYPSMTHECRLRVCSPGLAAGALVGLVLAGTDPALAVRIADIAQPVGKLWLNALQMTVVPLVLALVIVGVNTASDAAASGRVARRSIVVFLLVLTACAVFTAIIAPLALSMVPRDPALDRGPARRHRHGGRHRTDRLGRRLDRDHPEQRDRRRRAERDAAAGGVRAVLRLRPEQMETTQRTQMVAFFQAIADAMIVIVRWVLWVAPSACSR